jgi:malonyl-CoA/methylmalonyl-CoA synthetase
MWLIVSSIALSTFNLLESVFTFTFAEGRAILTETTRCSSSAAKCAGAPGRHADAAKHLVETASAGAGLMTRMGRLPPPWHMRVVTQSRLMQRFEELSRSNDVAVSDGLGSSSFAELATRSRALAMRLAREGLAGRRLALLAAQDRTWLEGFWAVLSSGGSVVPLSPLHPAREHELFLRESGAAALLVAEPLASTGPACKRLVFGDPAALGTSAVSMPRSAPPDEESAIALILYTSGTTGKPKGVPLTHQNVFDGVSILREAWELSARDRVLHTLPLHHVHGICVSLLSAFLSGAHTEMLPRYDPERVLDAASRSSVLMGVPTQHAKLVQYFDALPDGTLRDRYRENLRSQRLITSGSAALPEGLGRRIEALSGQYPLERYGMTEVGIVIGNPLHGPRLPGSCGRPLPRCRIRIVDGVGNDVEPGQAGELWIAGPSVFQGYDGDPAATAAAFESGFFKSGDTAIWTDDGYVRILGRTSVDIIKSGGYKLSALELEEHLREHPSVDDVAVVGVADEFWGERVVAVIVPRDTQLRSPASASEAGEGLRDWMKQRVAAYKVPRQVLFRTALPRNVMGKVQKSLLIAELSASDETRPSKP